MTEREKVTKGLKCCRDIHLGAMLEESCNTCPFQKEKGRTCDAHELFHCTLALLKAQEPIEARLNLCDSCKQDFGGCSARGDDIAFGCGVGNDNVIGCMAYVNRWKAPEVRVMTLEEVKAAPAGTDLWLERYMLDGKPHVCAVTVRGKMGKRFYPEISAHDWDEKHYDFMWRCWTARPTDEQREAVPWVRSS